MPLDSRPYALSDSASNASLENRSAEAVSLNASNAAPQHLADASTSTNPEKQPVVIPNLTGRIANHGINLPQADGFANSMGAWVDQHRGTLKDSLFGKYVLKDTIGAGLGLTALVAALVPSRYALHNMGTMAHEGAFGANRLAEALKGFHVDAAYGSRPQAQIANMISTAISFSTCRFTKKIYDRNYDRIVNAGSAEDSAKAICNLPSNIAHDASELFAPEFAATSLASVPLVGIQKALHPTGFDGHSLKHTLARIPAYTAFFETTERVFNDFEHQGGYPENEHSRPYGDNPLTRDGIVRILLRQAGGVAVGILPYTMMQHGLYRRPHPEGGVMAMNVARDNWKQAFKMEWQPYATFASTFVGADFYRNEIYDKLAEKLAGNAQQQEAMHPKHSAPATKDTSPSTVVNHSAYIGQALPAAQMAMSV